MNIKTSKEWFNLPQEKREKWGFWYLVPFGLEMKFGDGGEMLCEWDSFYREIKKRYPIQYFLREFVWQGLRGLYKWHIKEYFYKTLYIFKPLHKDIRSKIPRTEWRDITSLIEDVNFQFIISFAKEARESSIDWNYNKEHKEFYSWLIKTEDFLLNELPKTEELIPGQEDKVEKEKEKILINLIKYRHFFWT